MGMFDTINNVSVKCPRCGDSEPKSVQIKSGPQRLEEYEFGKDKIDINWDYEYYGSVINREKRIIRGVASCNKCKEEYVTKMEELIQDARTRNEIKAPEGEGPKYLIECQINGNSALNVILDRLDSNYGGNGNIELFDVAIWLDENYVPIAADVIVDLNNNPNVIQDM